MTDPPEFPNRTRSRAGHLTAYGHDRDELMRHRIIVLDQDIDDAVANRLVSQLLLLNADDPATDIIFLIDSPGGSVTAGLAITDTMALVSCDVATYAMGLVAGMGQFILSAGTKAKRYALPQARIVMRPTSGAGDVTGVRQELARMIAEHTGQTVQRILDDQLSGRSLNAEEAREYGLVDHIVTQLAPLTRNADPGGSGPHLTYRCDGAIAVEFPPHDATNTDSHDRFEGEAATQDEVRLAESRLLDLADLVNPHHSWGAIQLDLSGRGQPSGRPPDRTWTDPVAAGELYDLLRDCEPDVYKAALAGAVESGEPRAVLKSAIKVGRPESLGQLERLLKKYATREIVEDYLNSGSPDLERAGRSWAREFGFVVNELPVGGGEGRWGTR
ncbi:ClpP family protease [Saccharopolyspora sp. 5N708]|uniref:ClpP family protease n=1 Tax=Saccharopolyspora sp. 5N708 TaxID=3457424 RepID=UPI003FD58414